MKGIVRQLLIEFFKDECNYPVDRIRSEEPIELGKKKKEPEACGENRTYRLEA